MILNTYLLETSIAETTTTIILGLLGFVVVLFFIAYIKAFVAKITNTRFMNNSGRTTVDTDSFDNINEFLGEKIKSLATSMTENTSTEKPLLYKEKMISNIIYPGKGVNNINLGDTINKVIQKLGYEYKINEQGHQLSEYSYTELGISFYIKKDDFDKKVVSIKVVPPYIANTKRGIKLLDSSLNDIIVSYGKPEYTTAKDSDLWYANYKGISFNFKKDENLPKFPFNENAHLGKKIIAILVGK